MSNASHGASPHGGISALRAAASSASTQSNFLPSFEQTATASNAADLKNASSSATQSQVRDFAHRPTNTTAADNLDLADSNGVAQNELLRDVVFPEWGDDTGVEADESPEELQKKDPLVCHKESGPWTDMTTLSLHLSKPAPKSRFANRY
jgi:hypothetical protein